jgi:hypothetical protein
MRLVHAAEPAAQEAELIRKLIDGAIQHHLQGDDNNRQCWIEVPDGNRIELMQMGPNSMQVEAIVRLRA